MKNMHCPNCAANNMINSKYCSRCGYALPEVKVEQAEEPALKNQLLTSSKRNKRKNLIGAICGVIGFIISILVFQFFLKPKVSETHMMLLAAEANKSCPVMIDEITQLVNTEALEGNAFQYNYTLVNVDKMQVNSDTLRKYLEPGIIENIKTNPQLLYFRDHKTTMHYNYSDKNGALILKISITPDMYQ